MSRGRKRGNAGPPLRRATPPAAALIPSSRRDRRALPAHAPAAPLPLRHPAWLAAAAVATLCIALSVSFRIYEKDFWQHLAVGRAIWTLQRVPTTQLWTWPTYGARDVNSSWGFETLIWPVWQAGGAWGLFEWRWATTLAVFGLTFATARRLGARGFSVLLVLVLCSLSYRQRSQVRPETLASVWFALAIWLLEGRRQAGALATVAGAAARRPLDRALWLGPLLWAWVNTHLSYPLGFALLGAHLVDAHVARRGAARTRAADTGAHATGKAGRDAPRTTEGRTPASGLWLAGLLALALAFMNPFGWRALSQPFEYFFIERNDPIFRIVTELQPLDLRLNLRNGLPLILFGWPLLVLWRAARKRVDLVEVLLLAFIPLAFSAQRFLGFTLVAAAPYLTRDLDEWVRARRRPAWTAPAWSRAGLAAAACVLAGIAEWRRADLPLGIGLKLVEYPVAACDFMAREGVKGRGFNHFFLGGYMLHRFWPDRERLPFMDIHQAGTREDRDTYAFALAHEQAWHDLDRRRRFDYALLRRTPYPGDQMVEWLDADSAFALVFKDDAAALYVRRDGPLAALARRRAYLVMPAGTGRLASLGAAAMRDSLQRAKVTAELEREARESPFHALALGRLGSLELAMGDLARARDHLRGALAVDPRAPRAHERLGLIALAEGQPRDALAAFETERRLNGAFPRDEFQIGRAWQAFGDLARARRHYAREVERDPGNAEARDSLARAGGGR